MAAVDFITFCHPGDINRVYAGDWLKNAIDSHDYPFSSIRLIKQRCRNVPIHRLNLEGVIISSSEDYHDPANGFSILSEFGLPEYDQKAEHYTHGPSAPHYWKWHVINHLIGLKVSTADYVVFSDSDITIKSQPTNNSWISLGINLLKAHGEILIVGPGDGATMHEALTPEEYRLTQNVSQQVFLCDRKRLASVDFNIPWDWEFLAPGEPMQEYYYMLEGRIWRYMNRHGLWRCILPDEIARYWHHNRLTSEGMFEGDYGKY